MNWLSLLAAWSMALVAAVAATEPRLPDPTKPLPYVVVVTGGELLEGAYPDAHTPFLTRALRPLGCQCVGSMMVDDRREDIQSALRFATNRAPLVIVTGGLGPTPNDITRETLSDFTGIPLHEDAQAIAELERRFNQPRDQIRPNLRRQMLVPTHGSYLKNPEGTAVGLVFESDPQVLIALPGPPRELQAMVESGLVPYLRQRFGIRDFGSSLTLRFVGAGQSLIDQTLKEHDLVGPDVIITSVFEGGRVDFTFSLPGKSPADRGRLERLEEKIRKHLNRYIYGKNGSSLEDVVLEKLRAGGGSLTLVEVGSGGALAAALTGGTNNSSALAGAYVARSDHGMAKLLGLALEKLPETPMERAKVLASAAAANNGSQYAVAVGQARADDSGVPWVWITCKFPGDRWETQRLPLRGSSASARTSLTTQVLDLLRQRLP